MSTAEAEYIALSLAGEQATSIRVFLEQVGFPFSNPSEIKRDNETAMSIATSGEGSHKKTKHIRIRYHSIQDLVERTRFLWFVFSRWTTSLISLLNVYLLIISRASPMPSVSIPFPTFRSLPLLPPQTVLYPYPCAKMLRISNREGVLNDRSHQFR